MILLCIYVEDDKVKAKCVNRYGKLSGIVLHHASQESLGEEEARDPEDGRFVRVVPFLKRKVMKTCTRVHTDLLKYLNLEGFLEKFLKIKYALKSTGKSLKSLEKSLNSTIFFRT